MAAVMKRFFYHEKGNHDEAWYYLAWDTESGAVYMEHEWAEQGNLGSKRIEVAEFLSGPSMTARDNLLELIGTLVVETGDAPRPQKARSAPPTPGRLRIAAGFENKLPGPISPT